jgi:drug/metabolite transporter (DMT)-like permease
MLPSNIQSKKEKIKLLSYEGLLLIQCFLWGLGNPVGKICLTEITPFYLLAIRFLIASVFFLLFYGKRIVKLISPRDIKPCLEVAFFTFLSFSSSIVALCYTSAIKVGFLICIAIVFVPFLSKIILGASIDKFIFLPVLAIVVGLYFFCDIEGDFRFGLGEFLALFGAASGACMLVFSSKYLRKIDPLVICMVQTAFTGIVCLIIAVTIEDFSVVTNLSAKGVGAILYMAIFCTNIAYMIQNIALKNIPSMIVALMCTTEPIFTAIASCFLIGETLTGSGVIGAMLIFAGISVASVMSGIW